MANLSEPSRELAAAVLRQVDYEERLGGFRLDGAEGQIPQDLHSLEDVARFLRPDPVDLLFGAGGRGGINYVDLSVLSRWVAEVLGDAELAGAIREVTAQENAYGKQIRPVRELLELRLQQCRALIENRLTPAEAFGSSC